MKGLSKIHWFWLLLPIGFITVAAALVTIILTWRVYRLEVKDRSNQRSIVESVLYADSAKIAEEIYLGLDNISIHEKQLAMILSSRGTSVKLHFNPVKVKTKTDGIQEELEWNSLESSHTLETAHMPLRFGDNLLGDLNVELDWRDGWHFGGLSSLLVSLGFVLSLVILSWVIASSIFRKRIFQPFVDSVQKMSRWEAAAETTQMIAHDIRKPLYTMQIGLMAIQSAKEPWQIQQAALTTAKTVEKLSAEVQDLLQDLLDFERRLVPQRTTISLKELILNRLSFLEQSFTEKKCRPTVDIDPSLEIFADELQIRRVITNILRNALQAIDLEDKIWIRASCNEGWLTICIGNSGPIIAQKDLANLFDRFFTQGKPSGTGLGLAIAKKFVAGHGGEIWCHSQESNGTEFRFTLPHGKLP